MRLALGVLALFLTGCCERRTVAPAPVDPASVLEFERQNDVFLRHYLGCPSAGEISREVCFPAGQTLDAKNFAALRESAKKLFGFVK